MIDHVGLNVSDLAAAKAFYAETLEPLGYRVWAEWEDDHVVGFAADESSPDFWIYTRGDEPSAPTHVSFRARDRETVDAFHAAGLAAGGSDNGSARRAPALPRAVLRRVRSRPRRQQHRSRLPLAGLATTLPEHGEERVVHRRAGRQLVRQARKLG